MNTPTNIREILQSRLGELFHRSHQGTSFSPEVRAKSELNSWSAALASDLAEIDAAAAKYEADSPYTTGEKARYQEKFITLLSSYLAARGRCMSSMIVGPANFPTRRNEKNLNRERSASDNLQGWREHAMKGIIRRMKPEVTADSEVTRYETKLAELVKFQDLMKVGNKIVKDKKDEKVARLIAAGFSEALAVETLTPGFGGRVGFMPYQLQNNLAKIKATEASLKKARARQNDVKSETGGLREFTTAEGVRVVMNSVEDRIQIIHPEKPSVEAIYALKRAAFKWSPRNAAWQRQLTKDALAAAARLVGTEYGEFYNRLKNG